MGKRKLIKVFKRFVESTKSDLSQNEVHGRGQLEQIPVSPYELKQMLKITSTNDDNNDTKRDDNDLLNHLNSNFSLKILEPNGSMPECEAGKGGRSHVGEKSPASELHSV